MATYKIFKMTADGVRYAKAAKTLKDPVAPWTEALKLITELPGDPGSYRVFVVEADGELTEFGAASENETCANGHRKAEWWTQMPSGRKYCRKCATEASIASRAKRKAREAAKN